MFLFNNEIQEALLNKMCLLATGKYENWFKKCFRHMYQETKICVCVQDYEFKNMKRKKNSTYVEEENTTSNEYFRISNVNR